MRAIVAPGSEDFFLSKDPTAEGDARYWEKIRAWTERLPLAEGDAA